MNVTTPRAHISLEDTSTKQVIKPRTWTRLSLDGEDAFTLIRGYADIDLQLYVDFGTALAPWPLEDRPKTWQTMIRRLDGTVKGNVSSRRPQSVPPVYNAGFGYVVSAFFAEPETPLTVEVWHDGPREVVIREGIVKLLIVRAE